MPQQLGRREALHARLLHDGSVLEDGNAVGNQQRQLDVVGHEQDPAAAVSKGAQVIEGMEVEIPERMVTCQLDGLMHDLEQQLMQQGATMDAYLEMAGITREDLRRQAEASARASVEFELAMTEIARLEDIRFTDAELEEKYTQMSALYGMTPEQLKQNLPIERLTHDLRLARARAIVVDSAKPLGYIFQLKPPPSARRGRFWSRRSFLPRGELALVALLIHDPGVVQLPAEIAHDAV